VKNGIENISIAGVTYLLSARPAAFRWHAWPRSFSVSGNFIQAYLRNLGTCITMSGCIKLPPKDSQAVKGKSTMESLQRQNTEVLFRGRLSRSSDDVSVMETERRA